MQSNTKKMITMAQLQKISKKKGITIIAEGTDHFTNRFVLHKIIENPEGGLDDVTMKIVGTSLSYRFLKENIEDQNESNMSMTDYLKNFIKNFNYQKNSSYSNDAQFLYFIDEKEPLKGIISIRNHSLAEVFDLSFDETKIHDIWSEYYAPFISEDLKNKLFKYVEMSGAFDRLGDDSYDWEDDHYFPTMSTSLHSALDDLSASGNENSGCTYNSLKKIMQSYIDSFLSPVLKNYQVWNLWVASGDCCYFSIGRREFFPVLAGQRVDGSYEITIFEGVNTI